MLPNDECQTGDKNHTAAQGSPPPPSGLGEPLCGADADQHDAHGHAAAAWGVGLGDPRHARRHDEGGGQALHAARRQQQAVRRCEGAWAGVGGLPEKKQE